MPRKKVTKKSGASTREAKKTSASTRGRKKKLSELNQTHGKKEDFRPTSLAQVWGDTGLSTYSTLDEAEYEGTLRDMNKSDLQIHATRIGIIPIDNREILAQRLIREFRAHVNSYKAPRLMSEKPSSVSSEVRKILAEGR